MSLRLVLIAAVVLLLLPCALLARGGVYVDDFTVTNDGKVVFSDNFDSGNLDQWTNLAAATVPCDAEGKRCCMHLNMHTDTDSGNAVHQMSIDTPGFLEVSWLQWIAAANEQARHNVTGLHLLVSVHCQDPKHWIAAETMLCANVDQPALDISVDNVQKSCKVQIPTAKWVQMILRFDPKTSTISLLADNKVVGTDKYDPGVFNNLTYVRLESGLGDGTQRRRR